MTGWEKLGAGGIALGMLGGAIAIVGVLQLASGLGVPRPAPFRRLGVWIRRVLKRPGAVHAQTITDTGGITDSVSWELYTGTPQNYNMATLLAYVDEQDSRLRKALDTESAERRAESEHDRAQTADGFDQAAAHVEQRFNEVRVALAGKRGGGLWIAAVGLLLTFIGSGMQLLAALNAG